SGTTRSEIPLKGKATMTYAISAEGLALIQHYEGFCAEPAPLPGGAWVVGHGHVRLGEAGPLLGRAEAAQILAFDLAPVERLVNALVPKPLTQSQFDALVSFAFSVGVEAFAGSQVLRRVNSGDFVAAACAMDAWRKADVGGEYEVVEALVRRRAAEKALFLKELPLETAPSALVRAQLDHAASILGAPARYAAAPAVVAAGVARVHFFESNVVSLLCKVEPKFEAARLTEILKSEPATEAVLLRQAANDLEDEGEGEIVTAHAKPVARPLDRVREAARRAFTVHLVVRRLDWFAFLRSERAQSIGRRLRGMGAACAGTFARVRLPGRASLEHIGLFALLLFGLGLTSVAGSLLFGGPSLVEILAAIVLAAPGLAATLAAGWGLWRAPRTV
ncbi:MAG: lysozyme, partial [Vitreimonas sp.]